MPWAVCAVASCKNTAAKTKYKNPIVSYHSFPKNEKLRKIWVKFCMRRDEEWDPKSCHICSEHFEPQDFQSYMQNILTNAKARRRLCPSAYPKIIKNFDDYDGSSDTYPVKQEVHCMEYPVKQEVHCMEYQVKQEVHCMEYPVKQEIHGMEMDPEIIINTSSVENSIVPQMILKLEESLESRYFSLMQEHEELKEKYSELQILNKSLELKIEELEREASVTSAVASEK